MAKTPTALTGAAGEYHSAINGVQQVAGAITASPSGAVMRAPAPLVEEVVAPSLRDELAHLLHMDDEELPEPTAGVSPARRHLCGA